MREWIEENRGFWLLLTCTLIPIFFQLDRLLGAVGLRAIYSDTAFVVGAGLIIWGLVLGPILNPAARFEFKVVSLLLIAVLFYLIVERSTNQGASLTTGQRLLIFTSVFALGMLIVPSVVYLLVAAIFIGLKLAHQLRFMSANVFTLPDLVVVGIAGVMGFALMGLGTVYPVFSARHFDTLLQGEHIYHLQADLGGVFDPGIKLYQCTGQALWCNPVYESDGWYMASLLAASESGVSEDSYELRPTTDSNGVEILVNGQVRYTYVSDPKP